MFYSLQHESKQLRYKRLLNAAACLGKIGSPKSLTPQINYRASENIFCRSFQAEDLSSMDISIDALKEKSGFGIKTFQGSQVQKIAEFNDINKYPIPSDPINIAKSISSYRNKRLLSTASKLSLNKMIYHYVYRAKSQRINIFEREMLLIDEKNIHLLNSHKPHIIKFVDGRSIYSYNKTKSVLYSLFDIENPVDSFIFDFNRDDINYYIDLAYPKNEKNISKESVILYLFNQKRNSIGSKSGLNQWRAGGRKRHHDEVYIPIPIEIHKDNPKFFPKRDEPFEIVTSNGEKFIAKVCQDNNKALMSNPNRSLGKWILRDVLNVPNKELVTVNHLKTANIFALKIEKYDKSKNFKVTPIKGNIEI